MLAALVLEGAVRSRAILVNGAWPIGASHAAATRCRRRACNAPVSRGLAAARIETPSRCRCVQVRRALINRWNPTALGGVIIP